MNRRLFMIAAAIVNFQTTSIMWELLGPLSGTLGRRHRAK